MLNTGIVQKFSINFLSVPTKSHIVTTLFLFSVFIILCFILYNLYLQPLALKGFNLCDLQRNIYTRGREEDFNLQLSLGKDRALLPSSDCIIHRVSGFIRTQPLPTPKLDLPASFYLPSRDVQHYSSLFLENALSWAQPHGSKPEMAQGTGIW